MKLNINGNKKNISNHNQTVIVNGAMAVINDGGDGRVNPILTYAVSNGYNNGMNPNVNNIGGPFKRSQFGPMTNSRHQTEHAINYTPESLFVKPTIESHDMNISMNMSIASKNPAPMPQTPESQTTSSPQKPSPIQTSNSPVLNKKDGNGSKNNGQRHASPTSSLQAPISPSSQQTIQQLPHGNYKKPLLTISQIGHKHHQL